MVPCRTRIGSVRCPVCRTRSPLRPTVQLQLTQRGHNRVRALRNRSLTSRSAAPPPTVTSARYRTKRRSGYVLKAIRRNPPLQQPLIDPQQWRNQSLALSQTDVVRPPERPSETSLPRAQSNVAPIGSSDQALEESQPPTTFAARETPRQSSPDLVSLPPQLSRQSTISPNPSFFIGVFR